MSVHIVESFVIDANYFFFFFRSNVWNNCVCVVKRKRKWEGSTKPGGLKSALEKEDFLKSVTSDCGQLCLTFER